MVGHVVETKRKFSNEMKSVAPVKTQVVKQSIITASGFSNQDTSSQSRQSIKPNLIQSKVPTTYM